MEELTTANLFAKYKDVLKSYIFKSRKNMQDAEDIVQDVFLSILRNKIEFKSDALARGYLYKTVTYRVITMHNRPYQYIDPSVLDEVEHPLSMPKNLDYTWNLHLHVEKLAPGAKKVFKLLMDGWKQSEIAQLLNLHESTVKTQKQKALRVLNRYIKGQKVRRRIASSET